ncbi:MAG: SCP2 sterol-binding domain-containing protein [Myxococcales bacterium]|nr:SCP2 sterol-binding domain-containing protein [Myxococcales bacterium]
MPVFPTAPIPPSEFMEGFLPEAFAASGALRDSVKDLETRLGIKLEGEGGGEWVVHVAKGGFRVEREPRDEAAFTFVQSVGDWRGALWEGRGGAIGRQASALFRPDQWPAAAGPGAMGAPPTPAALAQMQSLSGLMRMVVTGGEGGDWRIDFKLGPGAIPDEATTTIRLSAEDAAAMERGELNPVEAFMAGRIQVGGDLTLVMQVQMIQMQAASGAAAGGGGSGS